MIYSEKYELGWKPPDSHFNTLIELSRIIQKKNHLVLRTYRQNLS